jgi:uncharacterized DUF497 family protein
MKLVSKVKNKRDQSQVILLTYHIICNILFQVKHFDWDKEKNNKLKKERGISFEEIVEILKDTKYIDIFDHPNQKNYPGQKIFVVIIEEYAYMVPFVEDEVKYFLKTIIPSRKMTKKYVTKGGRKK